MLRRNDEIAIGVSASGKSRALYPYYLINQRAVLDEFHTSQLPNVRTADTSKWDRLSHAARRSRRMSGDSLLKCPRRLGLYCSFAYQLAHIEVPDVSIDAS